MALFHLFLSATKLVGVLFTLTVTANASSFYRYRKKFLRPIRLPFDELSDTLAVFEVDSEVEEKNFFFGLATAPAHVEDNLNDAWLQFAEGPESQTDSGSVRCLGPVDPLIGSASADGGSQQGVFRGREMPRRRPLKIAMEAMIRGFKKYVHEDYKKEDSDHEERDIEGDYNVAAWHNVPHPEERLRFWSDPDTELKLAKDTGVSVFRMGIDWTRIMPMEPKAGNRDVVDWAALQRYKWIIQKVRSYGMKVMLTLFHHSLPPWAAEYGGWKIEKTVDYFMEFARLVVDNMQEFVDYWVTFNEPHVFCMLTYCTGTWPGGDPDMIEMATSALPMGAFRQAMHWMAVAHIKAYDYIHGSFRSTSSSKQRVGIAHHVSLMRPYGLFDVPAVVLSNSLALFPYVDAVSNKLDFIGINYYGQEVVAAPGLKLVEHDEYSESGRGVYPDGLYNMLLLFHDRYKHHNLPFIITENGVSDATDLIRRPYLLEHLLAIYAAILEGVRVLGYMFWTTSDNWEWADGYGPKFGLVTVDRVNGLARIPRPSYFLFSKVATTGKVTREERDRAWSELQAASTNKEVRPFYRAVDRHGLMYAGGLDCPSWRPFTERDWRFGHYQMDGLQDPLSRFSRFILAPFLHEKGKNKQSEKRKLVMQPFEFSV